MKRSFTLFFLIPLTTIAQLTHQPPAHKLVPELLTDNKKITKLDSTVDALVSKFMQSPENCGISIGITENGRDFFYNYGETKKMSGRIPEAETLYEIGSLTSTFCGMILAQAVSEKKINPEDDIRKYLPGKYPNLELEKRIIRVYQLANHTSGLPGVPEDLKSHPYFDSLNPYKNYSREMILQYLKTIQPRTVPGTECHYSNLGMALLGIMLENVYQQSFEILVREKICLPNQMNATAINLSQTQQGRLAEGHNSEGNITPSWDLGGFTAAGALKSTTSDLLKYMHYNLDERNEIPRIAQQITYSGHEKLGMAWFIKTTSFGNTLVWHNGATYGFACFAGLIKEKQSSVVILVNTLSSVDYIGIALLKYLQR